MQNTLKKVAVIMLIMIISLISFAGIYVKKLNKMENIVPEYKLGMDFSEKRILNLHVDTGSKTVYYDEHGHEVETETEGGSSKEVIINPNEVLTSENYQKSKEIMQSRMKALGATEYYLRQDENGYIMLEFPHDEAVDFYVYAAMQKGSFEMKDADTHEVLLSNDSIQTCDVVYNTTEDGTTMYLSIQLNKEGIQKLEEISKTYVSTTDEEGNTTTKNVTVSMDDNTLVSTYFGQTISNGMLQIPIGNPSTDSNTINNAYEEAKIYEAVLESGKLPVAYTLGEYENIVENTYTNNLAQIASLIGIIVLFLSVIYFIAKYKTAGIIAGILEIGFIAALLLVIRYTNCIMSVNGMIALVIISIFQFAFLNTLLKRREFNEVFFKYLKLSIPIDVVAVIYTFASWAPISSMGMVLFWGAVLFVIYNVIFTKVLVNNK